MQKIDTLCERMLTVEGKTKLYFSLAWAMQTRMNFAGYCGLLEEIVIPEEEFWTLVDKTSETQHLSHAEAILWLNDTVIVPTKNPIHPLAKSDITVRIII